MVAELFSEWWSLMGTGAVVAAVGFALFATAQAMRGRLSLEATWIAYAVALAVGLWRVVAERSLVDNAFIHFRHAANTVAGQGPVFNAGEHTEGVVALGWTLLLALGGLVGLSIPTWSVVLTAASYIALSALALRIGQGLWEPAPEERVYLPFAAMLLCVQGTITPFGTSGMETAAVAAATLATGAALVGQRPLLAGSFAVLATLIRPDHGVFWLAAMASVRDRASLLRVLAPGLALLPFAAFKLWFYGSLIPNPVYALGADELPLGQGLAHLLALAVGEHLWVAAGLFAAWWFVADEVGADEARFRRFASLGLLLHTGAVSAMGASAHYGQVYVTDIALVLLGAEALCHHRSRLPGWAAAGLLGATLGGLPLIGPTAHRWGLSETHTFFPLERLAPLKISHHTQALGQQFGRVRARGKGELTLATCCGIGVLAYTSGVEAIHTQGLTDAHLARTHDPEDYDYLRARGVDFLRDNWAPRPYRHLTGVSFKGMDNLDGRWFTLRYERERMAAVAKHAKTIRVVDFEAHLDRYLAELEGKPPEQVSADLAFFDLYYFDHNEDEARRAPIAARAAEAP